MKPGSILYERPEEFKSAFSSLMDRMRGRIVANPEILGSGYFADLVEGERLFKHFMDSNNASGKTIETDSMPAEVANYVLKTMEMTPYEALEYIAAKHVDSAQSRSDYKEISRAYNGVSCVAPCKAEIERGVDVMARSIRNYIDVMIQDDGILPQKQMMYDTIGTLDDAYLPFMDRVLDDMGLAATLKKLGPQQNNFEIFLLRPDADLSVLDNI